MTEKNDNYKILSNKNGISNNNTNNNSAYDDNNTNSDVNES